MALDENVRGALSQKDWAQAWEHGQDHLPLWGPLRSGPRAWEAGDRVGVGLNAAALGIEALGLKGALKGGGKGAAGKVKDGNAGDCSKQGGVPKVALPKTSKLPFDADALLKNAAEPNRNGLTNAGRALQKHANRAGEELSKMKFSGKTANKDAQKIIEKILNNPSTVVKDIEKGGYRIYDPVTKYCFDVFKDR